MLGSKASFGANNEHINTCCIRTNLMKNGCDILQQMNRAMCKTRSRMYMTINLRFNSNGPVLEDYCYASKVYFTAPSKQNHLQSQGFLKLINLMALR